MNDPDIAYRYLYGPRRTGNHADELLPAHAKETGFNSISWFTVNLTQIMTKKSCPWAAKSIIFRD